MKIIRRCERDVGEYVLGVNGWGENVFSFVTDDHLHGTWNQKTGEVTWEPEPKYHWWSCHWLFGPTAIDRSKWGLVDSDGKWRAVTFGKGKPLAPHIEVVHLQPPAVSNGFTPCCGRPWTDEYLRTPYHRFTDDPNQVTCQGDDVGIG